MEHLSSDKAGWSGFEKEFSEARAAFDTVGDSLGMPIDEGIKDALAAFSMLGLPTVASCEGHVDGGLPWPWVDFQTPDRPEYMRVGERKAVNRILHGLGASPDDISGQGFKEEVWQAFRSEKEAWLLRSKARYSDAYKNWREWNTVLIDRLQGWIDDFNAELIARTDLKLEMSTFSDGTIRLEVADSQTESDFAVMRQIWNGEAKPTEDLRVRLASRQQYMDEFVTYIKRKMKKEGAGI